MTNGLIVAGLSVTRDGMRICKDVSLNVPPGQITVLAGPTGAGKSTLLGGIAGVYQTPVGSIRLDGIELTHLSIRRRVRTGLTWVGSKRDVFGQLTVLENLSVAGCSRAKAREIFELFPRLEERRDLRAGLLSGGERQMLVIARALVRPGQVLLIDEWSQGLATGIASDVVSVLAQMASNGHGILLVGDHPTLDTEVVTSVCTMDRGRILSVDA